MYFLLAGMRDRFVYLDIGLAVLLVFIGAKFMLTEVVQIGVGVSLLVIVGIMTAAIAVVSVEIAVVCSGIVSSPGVGGERRPRQRTAAGAALRWARTPNRDARALSPHHKPPEALWRDPQRAGELRLRAP